MNKMYNIPEQNNSNNYSLRKMIIKLPKIYT